VDLAPLSRRSFLTLAGGLVLVACGGKGGGGAAGDDTHDHSADTTPSLRLGDISAGVVSSDLYARTGGQRFAFAVIGSKGLQTAGAPARVGFGRPGSERGNTSALRRTTFHQEGLPAERGIYTLEVAFDEAGAWPGIIEYDGVVGEFAVQVYDHARTVVPGEKAIVTPTPTKAQPLGVDPLCTLEKPCPFHTQSLDTLAGKGRPVALLFATPARCASQYCGPVLETLLSVSSDYRDRIHFVHVEIFKNRSTQDHVDAVTAWNLPSDPWLFTIDGGGTVRDRLDGAFDGTEIRAVLDRLVA
jgi:hypothetical protein